MAVKKETVNQIIEGLRQDMLDQLERNGAVGSYYTDMVEDWLMYWKTKKELADDIKKRGSKFKAHLKHKKTTENTYKKPGVYTWKNI